VTVALDPGEAAIRTVIAGAIIEHRKAAGRGLDALFAMRETEATVKALAIAGYEIRQRS
jgi:hypothetical protein